MIYRIFLASVIAFLISDSTVAQQSYQNNFFELNGLITGRMTGKYIYISYSNNENINVTDSVAIIDKKFTFNGHINSPRPAIISNGIKFRMDGVSSAKIYLEPKKLNSSVDLYDFKTLTIQGSKAHDEFVQLTAIEKNAARQLDSIYVLRGVYSKTINTRNDTLSKKAWQTKFDDLEKAIGQLNNAIIELEFNFIRQNPSSFVALDLLLSRLRRKEGMVLYDTIHSLYRSLTKDVQDSKDGRQLLQALKSLKQSAVGGVAPDFSVNDVADIPLSLTSFRNQKYVLLDFWASWCAPCREDSPFLIEMYKKYSTKGFEIISISRDENTALWRKAIEKDKVAMWKHFSTKENASLIETEYVVTAIPVKVLIDKDGVIIGRWRGGGEDNRAELEKILTAIFDK